MSRTRFPKGISTASTSGQALTNYHSPDPAQAHTFFNDFDEFESGEWTITVTGAASAVAVANVDGGAITLTDDAGANDTVCLTKNGVSFLPDASKELWYEARVKVSDATKSQILVGITNAATVPFTLSNITDGIFFHKPAAAKLVDFYVRKDATTGSQKVASITSLTDDTFVVFGVYYDGHNNFSYYVNDIKIGTLVTTTANFPDALTTPIFAVKNGEAVAKVMTADYVLVSKMR